ncbi:MAG: phosphate-starvation-inducible PsiE family protein [candidate division KSB1 bacterium]|nr:phosphate-starvation-inducible PsiE family protein [candidate division KSB1 bacterium]MDZ7333759.1 phosphate-starvation-inducible PsiE family protein [candidate division KSB1 bacterium]MDZ7358635.1 phosphate-starvation-inducible PsiE family protein [candidate division KSB1 bacterium]MDZ7377610.1 phosphate-starvation-inducible PsiE family protein [candidate division KSB1 bacterium]MDZ7400519.1 phosphate-starvation-inducible PsiE family protein [candidate division KSB1 bacterium]
MMSLFKKIERIMILALIVMMTIVLFLSIIELGWILAIDIISEPLFILEIRELLDIFGLFLLVLIGIELLDSIRTYVAENVIHVEVVLVVAMIAIARKVIILDIDKYSSLTFIGIASLILALSVAYYLIKKTHKPTHASDSKNGDDDIN